MRRMWPFWTVGDMSVASVVVASLAAGLAGFGVPTIASQPLPGSTELASAEYAPPQPGTGDFDWILFKNGEWLKGEIKDLQDESFSFESDELDTLQLDWEDIHAVYSPRQHTCVFEDFSSIHEGWRYPRASCRESYFLLKVSLRGDSGMLGSSRIMDESDSVRSWGSALDGGKTGSERSLMWASFIPI